jgi:predicted porin
MQKKILVLAVAAAISSPVFADSEVSIYGKVDMGFAVTDNGAISTTQVSSQVTKLGFKGAEDLGDGLSAIWQIEQQIDIDAAGSSVGNSTHTTFAGRNSFGGLKGGWGTVLLGHNDTPFKIATRKLDVFGDQLPDNRNLMGGYAKSSQGGLHDVRAADEVVYFSPDMSGFSAAGSYIAGAETADTAGQTKASGYSLAGMYSAGPLYAALAYQEFKGGSANSMAGTSSSAYIKSLADGEKVKAWRLGVGYTLDALQINAVYDKTSDNLGTGGADKYGTKAYYLAGVYSFGNDDVKLAYTHVSDLAGPSSANTGAKQLAIGYDHNMSKRTKIYAQYTKLSNDSMATYALSTAGSTANGTAVAAGNDPSAWIVGLYHSF